MVTFLRESEQRRKVNSVMAPDLIEILRVMEVQKHGGFEMKFSRYLPHRLVKPCIWICIYLGVDVQQVLCLALFLSSSETGKGSQPKNGQQTSRD